LIGPSPINSAFGRWDRCGNARRVACRARGISPRPRVGRRGRPSQAPWVTASARDSPRPAWRPA